jgi:hypothetical protein
LYARRNFGPFALISLPIFSRQLLTVWEDLRKSNGWLNRGLIWVWNGIGKETLSADLPHTIQKFLNLIIVAVIGFAAISKLVYVSHPVVVDAAVRSQFPVAAQEWAAANLPAGNLLNEYNWGGYLDWTLRNSPVFIDGRTDLFGDQIIDSWLEAVQAGPKWQEILDQWKIQWVMVYPNRPLVRALIDAGWNETYSDKQAVILVR